ncbi:MAG TPA: signal peptidase II [Solibacterales bacterium]|nr:signal peptidase II [Bryobacterales bacterium]
MSPRAVLYSIAATVFAVDRATKWIIESSVAEWSTIVVIPGFFQIIHTRNRGAAFSILADAPESTRLALLVGLSALVLGFIATLLWNASTKLAHEHWSLRIGLSLVFGGALGNVYDRALTGAVTDFLDFFLGEYHWPTFNAADTAITCGAALMLLSIWRGRRRQPVHP